MVVGGLVRRTEAHEEMVCNQALDMMAVVGKVQIPTNSIDHVHVYYIDTCGIVYSTNSKTVFLLSTAIDSNWCSQR